VFYIVKQIIGPDKWVWNLN